MARKNSKRREWTKADIRELKPLARGKTPAGKIAKALKRSEGATRRFAHHGYLAICANLYERAGEGNPDDVAAKVRADGGIPDAQMVGDTEAAVKWMRAQSNHSGKVGLFGSCSGGRHAFIYACQRKDVDACADLWGGRVVMGKEELNAKTPVAPVEMTKDLCCPLLGIFGNDDRAPSPEQVNQHEAELKKHGKVHEFYRYDGAGHGIFYWHRQAKELRAALAGRLPPPSSRRRK